MLFIVSEFLSVQLSYHFSATKHTVSLALISWMLCGIPCCIYYCIALAAKSPLIICFYYFFFLFNCSKRELGELRRNWVFIYYFFKKRKLWFARKLYISCIFLYTVLLIFLISVIYACYQSEFGRANKCLLCSNTQL
jgi:hypothetical protein